MTLNLKWERLNSLFEKKQAFESFELIRKVGKYQKKGEKEVNKKERLPLNINLNNEAKLLYISSKKPLFSSPFLKYIPRLDIIGFLENKATIKVFKKICRKRKFKLALITIENDLKNLPKIKQFLGMKKVPVIDLKTEIIKEADFAPFFNFAQLRCVKEKTYLGPISGKIVTKEILKQNIESAIEAIIENTTGRKLKSVFIKTTQSAICQIY
jgi:hypothetical protein